MRWKELKSNPKKKELLIKRSHLLSFVREFFLSLDFTECETPLIVRYPGMEPHLSPFETTVRDISGATHQGYLITSPEYAMKKLLAAGYDKIFQISKVFRNNESFGGTHNPEFTMIEWYRSDSNYEKIMDDCEKLMLYLVNHLKNGSSEKFQVPNSKFQVIYQGNIIDLTPPWPRISVAEAFERFASIKLSDLKIAPNELYEDAFWKIFLNEIEPKLKALGRPVFIYEYPIELGALARAKASDPKVAERFELYIGGLELANAFSELMDGEEQKKRLAEEQNLRRMLGKPVFPIDEDFIAALLNGPQTAAGIALGVDRLIMLLLDQKDINDVLWFGAKDLFSV